MRTSRPGNAQRGALVVAFVLLLAPVVAERVPYRNARCDAPRSVEVFGGASSAVACDGAVAGAPDVVGASRLLFDLPLDVNHATPEALQHLPGVGPERALAIVRARCAEAFVDVDALQRVPGIGPKTVHRLRPHLHAGPGGGTACAGAPTLGPGSGPEAAATARGRGSESNTPGAHRD